jgi:hypothetical protein
MSRRTGRNSSYTSGVNPSGFFRAEVVSVSGDYLSVKIPRLGLENIYEDVPFVGFTPAAGDKIWASFVEGNSSNLLCFIGAGDTSSDIAAIVAGVNLNGGGTGGSIQLSLDDSITLTSVTADNFYGSLTGDVTGNADTATTATNLSGGIGSIADGTALAPSLAFTSDSDTGIYRATADTIGFSAGNATRFKISPTLVEVIGAPFKANLIGPQTNDYLGIGAGETVAEMDGNLSAEHLWLGAESNINLVTTPDNWATGWAGRYETHLKPQGDGELRVTSDYGYIDLGPKNATWCHIYTDRGSFYMNKPLNMGAGSTVRGALTVDGTLDVTGGVTGNVTGDVTGNADTATTATNLSGGSVAATTLTASGDANFDSGTLFVDVSTNRVGINTSSPTQTLDVNGILNVSGDIRYNNNAIVASYGSSTNIDHIWHDETNNAWNFVSDSTYKAAGNSALNAATLNGTTVNATTVNATTVNLNTSVHLTNVDADGSMRVQGNTGYIEIGPKNDSACHIYTDLPGFYMDKYLNMNGGSTVRGALTVDGTLNAGSAAISGSLWCSGLASTGDISAPTISADTSVYVGSNSGRLSQSAETYGTFDVSIYARSGYYGVALGSNANLISNGSSSGLYWDDPNEWAYYSDQNGATRLHYNGSEQIRTTSGGVYSASTASLKAILYSDAVCGGTGNNIAMRWVNPYIKASVDNVVCATVGTVSDERFKKNIVSWNDGIDIVRQLRPVTYTPRDIIGWGEVSLTAIEGFEDRETKHGLIAQEVQAVMPTAVDGEDTAGGYLSLNQDELVAMLISAVKSMDERLKALEES